MIKNNLDLLLRIKQLKSFILILFNFFLFNFYFNLRYNNLIEILKITDNDEIIRMILSPERLAIEIDNIKKNI